MSDLFQNTDGASYQAQAVRAYLSSRDGIEVSWSTEKREYLAKPKIHRWHNCREQGYVVCMSVPSREQINIAFFEHRNSDSICAILWEQKTISGNPPTIETAEFGDVYSDKWDVSHSVDYGQASDMADWILEQLEKFWAEKAL